MLVALVLDEDLEEEVRQIDAADGLQPPVDGSSLNVTITSTHLDAADIATTLFLHGESINQGSYESAWTRFTSDEQGRLKTLHEWASGLDTSYWTDLNIERVSRSGSTATAHAQLSTRQDAANGGPERQTCSDWEFVYTLELVDSIWLIDRAKPTSRRAC